MDLCSALMPADIPSSSLRCYSTKSLLLYYFRRLHREQSKSTEPFWRGFFILQEEVVGLFLTSQYINAICEQSACLSQICVDRSKSCKNVLMCSWQRIDRCCFFFCFSNWILSKCTLLHLAKNIPLFSLVCNTVFDNKAVQHWFWKQPSPKLLPKACNTKQLQELSEWIWHHTLRCFSPFKKSGEVNCQCDDQHARHCRLLILKQNF